jgi:hypothetical protein
MDSSLSGEFGGHCTAHGGVFRRMPNLAHAVVRRDTNNYLGREMQGLVVTPPAIGFGHEPVPVIQTPNG